MAGLVENSNYDFAVFAVNKNGASEPAVLEDVYAKHSFTVPAAPGQPKIVETTETSADIEWAPPQSDGGNPVSGYDVYVKVRTSTHWRKVTKVQTKNTTYTLENLEKDVEYEVRVVAANAAGDSEPSKPSEPFKLTAAKVKPARQESALEETPGEEVAPEDVEKPRCHAENDYIEVFEGEDAEFVVEFSGKPTPAIKWQSTSETFQEKNHFELSTEGGKAICHIKKCQLQDSGDILVTFRNKGNFYLLREK